MIEQAAIDLAKQEGATHRVRLPEGSFVAYRPSRIMLSMYMMPGATPSATDLAFKYASRFFARNTSGFYVSEATWTLCRELPANVETI